MYATEFGQVASRLLDSIDSRLPQNDRENCRSYLNAGEWALLANDLAAALVDDQIPVAGPERDDLRYLLFWFQKLPKPHLRRINERENVLASLNVVEEGDL
jgi:hypothetical protein